jgi:hypothetical protein
MKSLRDNLRAKIFSESIEDFDGLAMEIFHYQFQHNPTYQKYCQTLVGNKAIDFKNISDIPFLPIELFKSHKIQSEEWAPEQIFVSSSTGGKPSLHLIKELQLYRDAFSTCFEMHYGDVSQYAIAGLLPSYLEREGSSLILMVSDLIERSADRDSGFFLHDYSALADMLLRRERQNAHTILFGVTFALLDFAKKFKLSLPKTTLIETGGMKGRGKEPIREEVHEKLKMSLGVKEVHSEYGMTELLSQAYMKDHSRFCCPPWMRPLVRDQNDPLCVKYTGKGLLNFIDLANIDSCSFIATGDLGECFSDYQFSVYGRADHAEMRGCNLMVAEIFTP